MFDAALHVKSQTEDDQGRRHHSGPSLAYLFEANPIHAGEDNQTVVPASQVESYKSRADSVPGPHSAGKTIARVFSKRVFSERLFSKRRANDVTRKFTRAISSWKQTRKQEFYAWECNPDVLRNRHIVFVISWFV